MQQKSRRKDADRQRNDSAPSPKRAKVSGRVQSNMEPFDLGGPRKVIYPEDVKVTKKKKKKKKRAREEVEERTTKRDFIGSKPKKKKTATLTHRLFVDEKHVKQSMLDAYTDVIPDALPESDEFGEPIEDRNMYVEGYQYHKKHRLYSFARGDIERMEKVFKNFNIIDDTAAPKMRYPIKFIGVLVDGDYLPLRPEQKKSVREVMEHGYGILQAPPRFGKTTVMTRLVTKYGLRTIVFVHQLDLAEQFEAEFRRCTDVKDWERKSGRKIIGIARKWEEVASLDIAIVTWQKFHAGKGGKAAIARFRDRFGLTLVDEGHRFSSKFSAKVVGAFNTRHRIGVTATPERKDKRDVVFKQIVGPVVAKGKTKQVPMRVHPVYTGVNVQFSRWTTLVKKLAETQARNKICLNKVEAEVKAGHSVLIVTTLRKHIMDLQERLKKRGIKAESFYGGVKGRNDILRRAKSKHTSVIIGMRSMLTGVNVPCWDRMHILMPTSNGPNHYQEFSRVRTPYEGKPFCVVHHYIDNIGAARGCYRVCHSNYTNPEYAPVAFIDDNGNVIKTPSLKDVNQRSEAASPPGGSRRKGVGTDSGAEKKLNGAWGWSQGGFKRKHGH